MPLRGFGYVIGRKGRYLTATMIGDRADMMPHPRIVYRWICLRARAEDEWSKEYKGSTCIDKVVAFSSLALLDEPSCRVCISAV
jgi:hypothetical protein